MVNIISESIDTHLRNLIATAAIDWADEAKSESDDNFTEEDESECKRQVCDKFIEIIREVRRFA